MTLPIVFDLDGTLVHSAPDIHLAVARMLEEERLPPLDLPTITSFIGNGLPKLVERVMGAQGVDMSRHGELSARVLDHYNAVNGTLTRLFPGVAEALDELHAAGHPIGLCTNKPLVPTETILSHFGIDSLFGAVVAGDSLPVKKPEPDGLLRAFEMLGRPGIYVGDSEIDAETAQNARMPFALFSGGYRKAPLEQIPHDMIFEDFRVLPQVVRQIQDRAA
ncbi:phosphoglycolate phosphatase [Ostreiculturibacter nitratireducens]|uniref:phosphoglycolate phosphatase n=1 Tax=Ostreiculturibacter nitratireducens TaxID=3075226 RepID=UPI0031B5A956